MAPDARQPADRLARRLALVGVPAGVAGLVAAGYLTYAHYTTATALACPNTGVVNCVKVTTSSYSRLLGIPVVWPGLVFSAVMIAFQRPAAWRSVSRPLRLGRLALSAIGMATVLWLVFAELYLIDAICLWCTVVHAMTLVLFVVTLLGSALTAEPDGLDDAGGPTPTPIAGHEGLPSLYETLRSAGRLSHSRPLGHRQRRAWSLSTGRAVGRDAVNSRRGHGTWRRVRPG